MKERALLLALAMLMGTAAAGAATPAGVAVPATAPDAATLERGLAAFNHRCAMCHREGQTGTFVLARRLGADRSLLEKRSDLTPDYIRVVVRSGLINMPRISRVELPDADLAAVTAWLTRPQDLAGSPSQR